MKQARVLTDLELKRLMAIVAVRRHAARDRLAIHLSHLAGLRVGEIASLTMGDVVDHDGAVRDQLRLSAAVTKGGFARTVFMSERLRKEITQFLRTRPAATTSAASRLEPLLITQKGGAFSGNTLCQLMAQIYRQAGLDGATSHSGRRFFITRLAHGGIAASLIMKLAGHKSLTTTQRYIETSDHLLRAAVETL